MRRGTERGGPALGSGERTSPEDPVITVCIEGRTVAIRAWRYDLEGVTGHTIPIYLLDTDLEQNDPRDRALTDHLYGGDGDYRLRQEMLGIGGARVLEALCYRPQVYHLNEGHASLLTSHCWNPSCGEKAGAGNRKGFESGARALRLYHPHAGSCRARSLLARAGLSHTRQSADQAYRAGRQVLMRAC